MNCSTCWLWLAAQDCHVRGFRLESVREKIAKIKKSIITRLLAAHAIIFNPSRDPKNSPENHTKSQILFSMPLAL